MPMKHLLLIITIFIAACIETDIYLPAFPDMMIYFGVSEEMIQSILTWNFVGICLAGPLYGPISDSIGRKKPLLFALGLFLGGSLLTLFSHHFSFMLAGRFLQGLGSGGCFTLGTAIIFDVFQKERALKALNQINAIVPFIMAAAPILGGYLNNEFGFRSNFLTITVFVFISLLICAFFFPEPLLCEKRVKLNLKKLFLDFQRAFTCLPFWQTSIVTSLIFSVYLAFLSTSAILFVIEFGISKLYFPYFQASLLIAWLCASLVFNTLLKSWGVFRLKWMGTLLIFIGGISFIGGGIFTPTNAYVFTLAMIIYAFGANWVQGVYFPEGMEFLPDIKGITASLLTSVRLLLTAMIVGITSHFYNGTIFPLVVMTSLLVFIILATIFFYERAPRKVESLTNLP